MNKLIKFIIDRKHSKEKMKEEKILAKKVYESGRYKNNMKELAIDFNNLPKNHRDISIISKLYPEYIFTMDKNDRIESIRIL